MSITTEHNGQTFSHDDREARVTENTAGQWLTCFGFRDADGFRASYGKPSRCYKTSKGAERAATKWVLAA